MEFYVSIEGEKKGPFTNYEISGMLRSGEIDGDSLVWMRGQNGWGKLRENSALKSSFDEDEPDEEQEDIAEETQENSPPLPSNENSNRRTIPIAHEVRPLTRFWARTFDYLLVTVFVWSISDIVPPTEITDPNLTFGDLLTRYAEELQKEEWRNFARIIFYSQLCWHVIEGLLLHVFGTTPGKALFGIRVKTASGRPPAIIPAIARSFYVYFAGVGLYLFPFSIIFMAMGFFRLMATGKTFWDEHLKMEVEHPPMGFARILLAIGAFLALMIVHSLKFT